MLRSGVRVPEGAGNFSLHHRVQTGSGAHPVSYPMGTTPGAFSLEVKRLGREADHPPPSTSEVKNAWNYTSAPPVRLHGSGQWASGLWTCELNLRRSVKVSLHPTWEFISLTSYQLLANYRHLVRTCESATKDASYSGSPGFESWPWDWPS
jgi:hypothetical protein